MNSVEDECMIGESNSSELKVPEQKNENNEEAILSHAWEDQDVSKPVRGLNSRIIARGSIKFGSGYQT